MSTVLDDCLRHLLVAFASLTPAFPLTEQRLHPHVIYKYFNVNKNPYICGKSLARPQRLGYPTYYVGPQFSSNSGARFC